MWRLVVQLLPFIGIDVVHHTGTHDGESVPHSNIGVPPQCCISAPADNFIRIEIFIAECSTLIVSFDPPI